MKYEKMVDSGVSDKPAGSVRMQPAGARRRSGGSNGDRTGGDAGSGGDQRNQSH